MYHPIPSILLTTLFSFLCVLPQSPSIKLIRDNIKTEMPKKQKRQSITFIMGEDEKAKNQYYAEAKNFYRYNELERTDLVVDTCRSLWSIKKYLETYQPQNGLAWGAINVVVHSNEWTGLSMPVFPNGERINRQLLEQLNAKNKFEPLSSEVADELTEIKFQSCGLGRNELLINDLENLFLNNKILENKPKLTASPYFVFYQSEKYKGIPIHTEKYQAHVWYAFYKTGYREGDIKLGRQLSKRYPDAEVNWREALSNKNAATGDVLFHYNFTIPIEWIVTFETAADRPVLATKKAQNEWLAAQPELLQAVKDYDIPLDRFRWKLEEIDYTFEDGITEAGILAKGLCTVVCVLQKI